MALYKEIEYILTNYFSINVGQTEEEAAQALEDELRGNRAFAERLSRELEGTKADESFLWSEALAMFEVATFEDEASARSYVDRVIASVVRSALDNSTSD